MWERKRKQRIADGALRRRTEECHLAFSPFSLLRHAVSPFCLTLTPWPHRTTKTMQLCVEERCKGRSPGRKRAGEKRWGVGGRLVSDNTDPTRWACPLPPPYKRGATFSIRALSCRSAVALYAPARFALRRERCFEETTASLFCRLSSSSFYHPALYRKYNATHRYADACALSTHTHTHTPAAPGASWRRKKSKAEPSMHEGDMHVCMVALRFASRPPPSLPSTPCSLPLAITATHLPSDSPRHPYPRLFSNTHTHTHTHTHTLSFCDRAFSSLSLSLLCPIERDVARIPSLYRPRPSVLPAAAFSALLPARGRRPLSELEFGTAAGMRGSRALLLCALVALVAAAAVRAPASGT